MYPSDYGYASSGCRSGEQILYYYSNEICKDTNWLYNENEQWLLSPRFNSSGNVCFINEHGGVDRAGALDSNSILTVIYLLQNVEITSGNGTIKNPYILSL